MNVQLQSPLACCPSSQWSSGQRFSCSRTFWYQLPPQSWRESGKEGVWGGEQEGEQEGDMEEASLLPINRSCTCVYFYFPTYLRRLHVQYFRNPSLCKGSIHQSKDEMRTRKTLYNTICQQYIPWSNILTHILTNILNNTLSNILIKYTD